MGIVNGSYISSLKLGPAVLSFANCNTENKLAEEAMRENETKFRALFENSTDALLLRDVFS